MKIIGLITEYNPFHNGHLYHIGQSKKETGAQYCIALMSGSFVQRGAPAIFDKYARAMMALRSGVDLVLEMPVSFSTASAKEFAAYGISLFTALGAVDGISFGTECGAIEPLIKIAALLSSEPEPLSALIKEEVKKGRTYPEARNNAIASFLEPEERALLNSPNNILGVEYCRAAKDLHSGLTLHAIKRQGSGYHNRSVSGAFCSATAIRQALLEGLSPSKLSSLTPFHVWKMFEQDTPVFPNDLSSRLNYRIWQCCQETQTGASPDSMEHIADMTPELASRIRKEAFTSCSFEDRIQSLKSRHITYTRVSRALLHLILNMKSEEIGQFKAAGYAPYARILGFKKDAAPLLTQLKKKSAIPLITKLADAPKQLPPPGLAMLNQEIAAAHLYQTIKAEKGCAFKNEYTQPIAII